MARGTFANAVGPAASAAARRQTQGRSCDVAMHGPCPAQPGRGLPKKRRRRFRSALVDRNVGDYTAPAPPAYGRGRPRPSSSGQDTSLSRMRPGFDSPWARHRSGTVRPLSAARAPSRCLAPAPPQIGGSARPTLGSGPTRGLRGDDRTCGNPVHGLTSGQLADREPVPRRHDKPAGANLQAIVAGQSASPRSRAHGRWASATSRSSAARHRAEPGRGRKPCASGLFRDRATDR